MTTKQLAKHFGVTVRTIYRWVEKGCPWVTGEVGTLSPNYKFDLKQVTKWKKDNMMKLGQKG